MNKELFKEFVRLKKPVLKEGKFFCFELKCLDCHIVGCTGSPDAGVNKSDIEWIKIHYPEYFI